MARIKDSSVEAVKAAADFVDVVSARTQLRKAGGRYTGRCPFHEERTPSFSVNAVDKLYYCFGCGAKGDLITFVRETEGLDFAGSIEWLGERFRIPLEYEESSPAQDAARKRRERLFALLDQAAAFYERTLWETEAGSFVRDYLKGRGLNEEVCREFRLGFALGGDSLARKAIAKGFTREELRAAGLDAAARRRLLRPPAALPAHRRARTRARLPGAQALRRRPAAREVRQHARVASSSTRVGSSTGSTRRARRSPSEDRACVVEGNTDVIALRQAGFQPVVASMGTALTEQQLKELGTAQQAAVARVRRRRRRRDGDVARDGARGPAGVRREGRCRCRPASILPTTRPDSPRGSPRRSRMCSIATKVEIERAEDRETAFRVDQGAARRGSRLA